MRVLVSGACGFVGSAVCRRLRDRGDGVERLVRGGGDGVLWDPKTGRFDVTAAEGADAVVHLAGENVFSGRWNEERKAAIRDSRVTGTRLLAEGLARLKRPPRVIACASAVGFYGGSGDVEQSEEGPSGRGFLADVCREWESACTPAVERGIRVANLRIGLVLSAHGGALRKMLPVFRLGLGGRIGDGRQWMSWITLDDLVRVVEHVLFDDTLAGAVNAVAPHPVRNEEFTRALARVLGRPAVLPVAAVILRLALGEMADELLLSGTRAVPNRLRERGFRFGHAQIEPALHALLER
jgi:uncharacterized protein (TIGR01777 family)